MSRILLSSDWHPDVKTAGFDRFDDVADAVAQTVKTARDEKVDLYLMMGDLCDPDDGPSVLRAVSLAVDAACELSADGIASVWIKGNHDVVEDGSGLSTLTPLRALNDYLVRAVDEPAVLSIPGKPRVSAGDQASLVALPYPPASLPYDPAEWLRERRKVLPSRNVVVAGHLMLEGITPGEETTEMPRGRDVAFPLAECAPDWLLLNGHYHEGQVYERGGRRVVVPGALARLTHGEEKNRPRYLLIEV